MTYKDSVLEEQHYYSTLNDLVDLCKEEGYYLVLGDLCNTTPVTDRNKLYNALDKILKEF